jgi:pyruvate dehydrogenase E2 component (dihydrolipoamide acetyltransferase)
MATNVHMEALSPTMEEGQLVKWHKNEGDSVNEGDVLADVETDKATMELVARGSGVLRNVSLQEGQTAAVGSVIAVIAGEGEEVQKQNGAKAAKTEEKAPRRPEAEKEPEKEQPEGVEEPEKEQPEGVEEPGREEAAAEQKDAAPAEEKQPERAKTKESEAPTRERHAEKAEAVDGRLKASPLARRLASERGLELEGIRGSGPGGRIVKADIEAALASGSERGGEPAAAPAPVSAVPADGEDIEEVPISQMRKTIAKRLVTSIGPVPTFYLTVEVDATRLMEMRQQLNARLEEDGVKASVNDFIVKAVATALARHPEVNSQWGDGVIYRHHRVHMGVAVAIEDGLITPVVRDADRKGIREIATQVKELAGRAREKKLKPEEYTGATFSVSNLGMFGIEEFTAIINPPESGILAIGRVEDRVVAENGRPVVRPRMRMTMSCDHRVVDGATGARFLQTVKEFLEDPMMMLA